jgi:hypothetical protein
MVAADPAPAAEPVAAVLHVAEPLVEPGAADVLFADFFCDSTERSACRVRTASVHVETAEGPLVLTGELEEGRFRFDVSGTATWSGYTYWIELVTEDGERHVYPRNGEANPIVVSPLADFSIVELPTVRWSERAAPAEVLLSLSIGDKTGQLGVEQSGDGDLTTAASFAEMPDGRLVIGDWVNERLLLAGDDGIVATAAPFAGPFDLAVRDDTTVGMLLLGLGSEYVEVNLVSKHVSDRVPVEGVPYRLEADDSAVLIATGPGVWESPSGPGATTRMLGTGAVSQVAVGDELAVSWTSSGGPVDVLLRLPNGLRPGTNYFAEPLPEGGVVVAWGVWDDTNYGVALLSLDDRSALSSFVLLPEPSVTQAARASTVQWSDSGRALVALDGVGRFDIAAFELGGGR